MVSTECGHSGLKYTRRRAPASRYIPSSGIPIKPINGSKFSQAVPASSFWSLSYSMQKRRGKAWEKESRAWRQVDVSGREGGGARSLCWSASSPPNNELYWRCLSNVTVSSSWRRYYEKDLEILRRAPVENRRFWLGKALHCLSQLAVIILGKALHCYRTHSISSCYPN